MKDIVIKCPFCSCRIHSRGRNMSDTASQLMNHLLHYHVGGDE